MLEKWFASYLLESDLNSKLNLFECIIFVLENVMHCAAHTCYSEVSQAQGGQLLFLRKGFSQFALMFA